MDLLLLSGGRTAASSPGVLACPAAHWLTLSGPATPALVPDLPYPAAHWLAFAGGRALVLPPPPVIPAGSFVAAIGRALALDPALAALLGGTPGVAGSDGAALKVWLELAPKGTPPPFLEFEVSTEPSTRVAVDTYTTTGTIRLTAYAPGRPEARDVANAALPTLIRARDAGAIAWRGGRLMDLWPVSATTPGKPMPARRGTRLWGEPRAFGFTYQGPTF